MGIFNTQIINGALYADITAESLGLPAITPLCGIPIEYGKIWDDFGKAFKEAATTTCPVDTGFLRKNIDFQADQGGVECWSDAKYSAYQEYGTSKMRAQPYFEAAIQSAYAATKSQFEAKINWFREMDSDFSFLLAGCTGGIAECYHYLNTLKKWIVMCDNEGYDTTILRDAYVDVLVHIQEMEKAQMMSGASSGLGFFGQLIAMILATLITVILTFPFQMMWENKHIDHYPSHV